MWVHRLEKTSGSHTTKFSMIEQKYGCFSYIPATAVCIVSSITIPIKCREVSTLPRVTFWEVSPSTNTVLKNKGAHSNERCYSLGMKFPLKRCFVLKTWSPALVIFRDRVLVKGLNMRCEWHVLKGILPWPFLVFPGFDLSCIIFIMSHYGFKSNRVKQPQVKILETNKISKALCLNLGYCCCDETLWSKQLG